jgi:hypothetical protein
MLGQHREGLAWLQQVARCWAAPPCASRKMLAFAQSMASTATASVNSAATLTVQQQQRLTALWLQAQRSGKHPGPLTAMVAAERAWADLSGTLRDWGMISAQSQARMAGAFADLWSLPESD